MLGPRLLLGSDGRTARHEIRPGPLHSLLDARNRRLDTKQGVASVVDVTLLELGAAIDVALAGSVPAAAFSDRIAPVAGVIPEPASSAISDSLAAAVVVTEAAGPRGPELETVARYALPHGMQQASWALGAVVLVGAGLCAWRVPGRS